MAVHGDISGGERTGWKIVERTGGNTDVLFIFFKHFFILEVIITDVNSELHSFVWMAEVEAATWHGLKS